VAYITSGLSSSAQVHTVSQFVNERQRFILVQSNRQNYNSEYINLTSLDGIQKDKKILN
jgi:hypothetical protein